MENCAERGRRWRLPAGSATTSFGTENSISRERSACECGVSEGWARAEPGKERPATLRRTGTERAFRQGCTSQHGALTLRQG